MTLDVVSGSNNRGAATGHDGGPDTRTLPPDVGQDLPPPVSEDETTHELILRKLERSGLLPGRDFRLLDHPPVRTSEQAATVRNVPLATGAKALLYRDTSAVFLLVVLSAATRIDNKKFKKQFGKNTRAATEEEVRSITGCLPGAVPPFGSVFGREERTDCSTKDGEDGIGRIVPTFVDRSMLEQGTMCFNAGLRGRSVVSLNVAKWVVCEGAEVVSVGIVED